MPSRLTCQNCGTILGEWRELPPHLYSQHRRNRTWKPEDTAVWYDRLYSKFSGKYPNCRHALPTPESFSEEMQFGIVLVEKGGEILW